MQVKEQNLPIERDSPSALNSSAQISRAAAFVVVATLLAIVLAIVLVGPVMNFVGLQSFQG